MIKIYFYKKNILIVEKLKLLRNELIMLPHLARNNKICNVDVLNPKFEFWFSCSVSFNDMIFNVDRLKSLIRSSNVDRRLLVSFNDTEYMKEKSQTIKALDNLAGSVHNKKPHNVNPLFISCVFTFLQLFQLYGYQRVAELLRVSTCRWTKEYNALSYHLQRACFIGSSAWRRLDTNGPKCKCML